MLRGSKIKSTLLILGYDHTSVIHQRTRERNGPHEPITTAAITALVTAIVTALGKKVGEKAAEQVGEAAGEATVDKGGAVLARLKGWFVEHDDEPARKAERALAEVAADPSDTISQNTLVNRLEALATATPDFRALLGELAREVGTSAGSVEGKVELHDKAHADVAVGVSTGPIHYSKGRE